MATTIITKNKNNNDPNNHKITSFPTVSVISIDSSTYPDYIFDYLDGSFVPIHYADDLDEYNENDLDCSALNEQGKKDSMFLIVVMILLAFILLALLFLVR